MAVSLSMTNTTLPQNISKRVSRFEIYSLSSAGCLSLLVRRDTDAILPPMAPAATFAANNNNNNYTK